MVPVTSPDKVKQPRVRSPGPVLPIPQKGTNRMQIRAAELTADNLSRIVRIDHDDDTFVVGRLVKIRHRRHMCAVFRFDGADLWQEAVYYDR